MFNTQDAIDLARQHYDIEVTAEALAGELDLNFKLVSTDGSCYVLKLHTPATNSAILEMQNHALEWLASGDPGLSVPRLIPCTNGQPETIIVHAGQHHTLRLLSWLEGTLWSSATIETLESPWSLGNYLARLDSTLAKFSHPAAQREFLWDMRSAERHNEMLGSIEPVETRTHVANILSRFEKTTKPALMALPQQVIHNDANDNNILLDHAGKVCGLIDYGDMILGHRISEIAIACAYIMCGQPDPVGAAIPLVAGYHAVSSLKDIELELLFDLIQVRIASSISMAARQIANDPENSYLGVSQQAFRTLLALLAQENRELVLYRFRDACGYSPHPATHRITRWLQLHRSEFNPICRHDLSRPDNLLLLDIATDGVHARAMQHLETAQQFTGFIFDLLHEHKASVGIGRYLEKRGVYKSAEFETLNPDERRDRHLGVDLFIDAGEPLYAPLEGIVECLANRSQAYDFGPTVILRHEIDDGTPFWTLYGHLSLETLDNLEIGQHLEPGEVLGWIGNYPINGDWPPHTHFQIMTSLLGMGDAIHGVGNASMLNVWESICPDPNLMLQIPYSIRAPANRDSEHLRLRRRIKLGRMLSLSYEKPLKIVRGEMQYLFDHHGNRYLDMVNNVCHVGHCHPRVVAAGQRQLSLLNTNTRYLHDNVVEFANRLTATLPDPLDVCFFVNSGSEANDLALRLTRAHTGRNDMLVLDQAYHGNLSSLVDISPYKFLGLGGRGKPDSTWVCDLPDTYRGPYKREEADAGAKYAESVRRQLRQMQSANRYPAAFIAESLGGVSGQIVLPDGYLETVYPMIRSSGGLCIADEVQVGLGRMGRCMWGFETQGVVPDIVTIGKPLGNGHPLAVVVTTAAIAESFNTGMEYFNTFGGNPVSAAIGLAVLDALRYDNLMPNAAERGRQLKNGLEQLQSRHQLIGDVRGIGLFVGAELVNNRQTLEPATNQAKTLVGWAKSHGILLSTDGKYDNTLKIKPPVCINEKDVAFFLGVIDEGLTRIGNQEQ